MQRIERILLTGTAAVLCCLLGALPASGQSCTTSVNEANPPTVFSGFQTNDPTFGSYFWEWGPGTMDQDGTSTNFFDAGSSQLAVVSGALWANVAGCSTNPTTTGILVWAQTTDSGGKVALAVGSQNIGSNVDLDEIQDALGGAQSIASTISAITVDSAASGNDGAAYTDYSVSWSAPSSTLYAVNDQSNDVFAGYAIYYRTDGPSNTGDTTGWTLLTATASSTDPYITDDGSANDSTDGYLPVGQASATIRTRGSSRTGSPWRSALTAPAPLVPTEKPMRPRWKPGWSGPARRVPSDRWRPASWTSPRPRSHPMRFASNGGPPRKAGSWDSRS